MAGTAGRELNLWRGGALVAAALVLWMFTAGGPTPSSSQAGGPPASAALLDDATASAVGTQSVGLNLFGAYVARGPEAVTAEEAAEIASLPPLDEPPPTLHTTTTTERPPTTGPPLTEAERRGFEALGHISYDWQSELPDWRITFSPGRSGVLGYTYVDEKAIEIFVRDEQSVSLLAHVIAHEIGHAVDVSKMNGSDRTQWQEARGISDRPWWPGNGANDFSTGTGDFAESFAAWQVGVSNFRSNLAGVPTASQMALLAELAHS